MLGIDMSYDGLASHPGVGGVHLILISSKNPNNRLGVNIVLSDLFHAPGMLHFTNPSGNPATDDDPLIVHKFISQPLFGGGQVILRPGAEKGRQFVRNDTMVS